MEYKKVKLGEVCKVNQGLQIPISKRFKEKGKNRYFYITIQFLKGNTEEYYIENPNPSVICNKDDILVVRTGNTGMVLTNVEGCFHNNFFKVVPNDNIYSKYLYYALKNKDMHRKMLNAASGTTIPDLKHSDFYQLEIYLPDINKQKKIANILSNIDKKIELDNQINKGLSNIADEIFNDQFEKNIDKNDYKIVKMQDICKISAGGDKPKDVRKSKNEEYKIPIYSNGIEKDGLYGYTKEAKISNKSVTISARGTIGYTCLRLHPYVPIVRLISLEPDIEKISAEYLYFVVKHLNILGTGTTQQQLTVPNFKNQNIKLFDFKIIEKFTNIVEVMYRQIDKNKEQNEELKQLRDTLLPKLMNGEIDLDKIRC